MVIWIVDVSIKIKLNEHNFLAVETCFDLVYVLKKFGEEYVN